MKLFSLKLVMLLCVIQGTIQVAIAADAQEGEASYYADSLNGNKTASGEPYTTLRNESQGYLPENRTVSQSHNQRPWSPCQEQDH